MDLNDQEVNTESEATARDQLVQAALAGKGRRTVKRHWVVLLSVVGLVVLLLVAGGVYVGIMTRRPARATPLTTYAQPRVPFSFPYPAGWQVSAEAQPDGSTTTDYRLTFRPGAVTAAGDPEQATVIVTRWEDTSNTPLAEAVLTIANDPQHLLALGPCHFQNPNALECREITDQTAWAQSGHLPAQTVVFFRVPGAIYGITWGQADTFNFQQTAGQEMLRGLRFGLGS